MDGTPLVATPVDHDPFAPMADAIQRFGRNVLPWAAQQGRNIASAFTLPHDAMTQGFDPSNPQDFARAQMLAGLATGAGGAAPAEADALNMGIRAYHGSPHDFGAFDVSKIGTGEGAQAYGHGLYFAENPAVANAYSEAGPAASAQYAAINSRLSQLSKTMDADSVSGQYRQFKTDAGRNAAAEYDSLMATRANGVGHLYDVDINADPEHFLDWDKPLSQQSPHVQNAVKSIPGADNYGQYMNSGMSFGDLANRGLVPGSLDKASPKFSKTYSDAGIPGIKYLDQGSRGAGEGSSNYVLFHHDPVSIVGKDGKPYTMTPVDHDPFGDEMQ